MTSFAPRNTETPRTAETGTGEPRCVHRFDFIPFAGIICVKCRAVATTETTPLGHTVHNWVKQGLGTICDGCGLIRSQSDTGADNNG